MGSKDIFQKQGIGIVDTKELVDDSSERVEYKDIGINKPTIFITKGTKEAAVKAGIIPNAFIDCDFDLVRVKENQQKQFNASPRKFLVQNFDLYSSITSGIRSTIIANKLPDQSYLIGAPNGFGKTSFVNSCILKLFAQNRMCTPYISLTDLAQVKLLNERRILSGITSKMHYKSFGKDISYDEYNEAIYEDINDDSYVKKPMYIIDKFSWSEYMSCDVLFCYFTDVGARVLESEIFKTVITVRGTKGLPTIAMISTSLNLYKKDANLAEYVWNEILSYDDTPSYDRVKHISCWKNYNIPLIK